MSRAVHVSNYRVEVYPRRIGDLGMVRVSDSFVEPDKNRRLKEYKQTCEGIATDIKRHVDDVGSVHVVFDSEPVCSFCGSSWSETSESYNGGCCLKDEESNPEVEAVQS